MGQLHAIGRVTADLELKHSEKKKRSYVEFSLAENFGYGESAYVQYYRVWAWGHTAKRLIDWGVKKGSLIWITGFLRLVDFQRKNGTKDKGLKIFLDNWGYVPNAIPKSNAEVSEASSVVQLNPDVPELVESEHVASIMAIDGDKDTLPE